MKKTLAFILALCLCVGLCACSKGNTTRGDELEKETDLTTEALSDTFQYPAKNSEWEYDVYERHIVLTKYIGNARDVVIPETIDGIPVTKLKESDAVGAGGCFSGLSIGKVTLNKNIKFVAGFEKSTIHTLVFANDEYIEFDRGVFNFCDSIQNIDDIIAHIPGDELPDIFAHSESSALHTVTIPDRFTKIERGAFWGCSEMQYIDIGNVSEVADLAFGQVRLLGLTVHNKDCKIYDDAFAQSGYGYGHEYSDYIYTKDLVIYAPAGSTAAKLASELSFDFSLIEK